MLWTLTITLLNRQEILIGFHLGMNEDPVNQIPVYSFTIGLLFMSISVVIGKKKKRES